MPSCMLVECAVYLICLHCRPMNGLYEPPDIVDCVTQFVSKVPSKYKLACSQAKAVVENRGRGAGLPAMGRHNTTLISLVPYLISSVPMPVGKPSLGLQFSFNSHCPFDPSHPHHPLCILSRPTKNSMYMAVLESTGPQVAAWVTTPSFSAYITSHFPMVDASKV